MEVIRTPLLEKVPIRGPASVAIREFRQPGFDYPWHQHPEVELAWVLKGSGLRYVGDSVEPFSAGDFCLIGSNLPHTWLSTKETDPQGVCSFVVQFDPDHLGGQFLELPEFAGISRLLERAAKGLRFSKKIGEALRPKLVDRDSPLLHLTALLEILEEMAEVPDARTLSLAPWTHNKRMDADPRLRRVLAYLTENASEPIVQTQVAHLAGLSPAAFSRFFRRAVGKTFQAYLTDLRLSVACRQLLETDFNVSEIAYASGFGNLSNFNRSFRLLRGMSPREFRRQSLQHA